MTDNVVSFGTDTHPHSNALINAIEKSIEEIAMEKMTNVEVIGCLQICLMNVMLNNLDVSDDG